MLAGVLADIADPAARLAELEKRNLAAIRPYFDVMVKQDAQAIRRAANEQIPGYQPRFKARVVKSLLEDAIGPASRGDLAMMRAMMRAFHMLDDPTAWIRKPATVWKILRTWATPKRLKAHLYEPSFGPQRAEMLRRLAEAHGAVQTRIAQALPLSEGEGFEWVNDLLIQRQEAHSKMRWMLQATLGVPSRPL